ncbi:hypothetical protein EV182_001774 [Spiromyces aspiralis]|uniref:Uncharacterized protein n=1 Tax=Spiromyces aspiralis TaxID=68401 RepID=A0ACC1HSN2_9FUNG|nr:hypothetical protein EV182_001774 [Spiromyces aspiralis]
MATQLQPGSSLSGGNIGRGSQYSPLRLDPTTGLPTEDAPAIARRILHPHGLTRKQWDMLNVACELAFLLRFTTQEIEDCVHAGLRFLFFTTLLDKGRPTGNSPSADFGMYSRITYSRWLIRSAYREEQAGLVVGVDPRGELTSIVAFLSNLLNADEAGEWRDSNRDTVAAIHHDLGWFFFGKLLWRDTLNHLREYQSLSAKIKRSARSLSRLPAYFGTVNDVVTACEAMVGPQSSTAASAARDPNDRLAIMRRSFYGQDAPRKVAPSDPSSGDTLLRAILSGGAVNGRESGYDIMHSSTPASQAQPLPGQHVSDQWLRIRDMAMHGDPFDASVATIREALSTCLRQGSKHSTWCHNIHPLCLKYIRDYSIQNRTRFDEVITDWVNEQQRDAATYTARNRHQAIQYCADTVSSYILGHLWSRDNLMPAEEGESGADWLTTLDRGHFDQLMDMNYSISKLEPEPAKWLRRYSSGIKHMGLGEHRTALGYFSCPNGDIDMPPAFESISEESQAICTRIFAQMRVYRAIASGLLCLDESPEILEEQLPGILAALSTPDVEIDKPHLAHLLTASLSTVKPENFDSLRNHIEQLGLLPESESIPNICLDLMSSWRLLQKLNIKYNATSSIFVDETPGNSSNEEISTTLAQLRESVCMTMTRMLVLASDKPIYKIQLPEFFSWFTDPILLKMFIGLASGAVWNYASRIGGPQDGMGCIAYLLAGPDVLAVDTHGILTRQLAGVLTKSPLPPTAKGLIEERARALRDMAVTACHVLYRRCPGDNAVALCMMDLYRLPGLVKITPNPISSQGDLHASIRLFLNYMAQDTAMFSADRLEATFKKDWYRSRIGSIIECMKAINKMPVNYNEVFAALQRAVEMGQLTSEIGEFLWDPSIIEYAQCKLPLRRDVPAPNAWKMLHIELSEDVKNMQARKAGRFFSWLAYRHS